MSRAKSLRIITSGVKEALLCCLSFVDLLIEFLSPNALLSLRCCGVCSFHGFAAND